MRYRDKVQKIRTDLDALVPDEYTIILPDFAPKPADTATHTYLHHHEATEQQINGADYVITPAVHETGVKQI